MNKLKQLRLRLIRDVGIAGAIVAGFVVFLVLTGALADASLEKKNTATGQLQGDRTQLNTLRQQYEKSGTAEKRFVDIAIAHPSTEFGANTDVLKELLRKAKDHFRLSDSFKLNLAQEKIPNKPEFSGLNYDIGVREPMRIDFDAMSDVHVYAFIDYLQKNAPGMVRITSLHIKRNGNLDAESLTKMNGGDTPALVTASIEFTWVGIGPKKNSATEAKPKAETP